MEQTNAATATSGPATGPQSLAASGWSVKNRCRQNASGIHAAAAPAISRPMRMSRSTAARSITKLWLTAVKLRRLSSRRRNDPSPATDMSIAA